MKDRATNREESPTTKSKKNLTKTKRFVLKLHTDQIHLGTNLSPKIHRLGLIETPGKSDRGQERKTYPKNEKHSTGEERKSQATMKNPGGQKEDLGLHSHTKISTKYTTKISVHMTSLMCTRRTNPRWKEKMREWGER
jgi:hypothetical protein